MATAFQSNAFQVTAFQIAGTAGPPSVNASFMLRPRPLRLRNAPSRVAVSNPVRLRGSPPRINV